MDMWQRARARQLAGRGIAGAEGTDVLTGDAGQDRLTPEKSPAFDLDRAFITKGEDRRLDMYVPDDKGRGHSGPTIGIGVDLGQKDLAYMKSLGLDPRLVARLTPYLGMKNDPARAFVKDHPLVLSDQDADTLTKAVQDKEFNALASKFDAASQVGAFRTLPRNTQTAIASLYYQYGTGDPAHSTPDYWRQITSGDWNGAYHNLLNFGDGSDFRRQAESKRLLGDIQAGTLPKRR